MPRNRVIYQSEALFSGPSPASGQHSNSGVNLIKQLHRVQNISYSFNVERTDTFQFGQLGRIGSEILTTPTVNLDYSYLITNVYNEKELGLTVNQPTSFISGILSNEADEQNMFILTVPEGQDAVGFGGAPAQNNVIGIGNAFLSNYSVEASVGSAPTASVTMEGLNFVIYGNSTGQINPAINPVNGLRAANTFSIPAADSGIAGQVPSLRPGDITYSLNNASLGIDLADAKLQSFTINMPLSREPQERLGSRFAFSRELSLPIAVDVSITANVGDLTTGALDTLFCQDAEYDLVLNLNKPTCTGAGELAARYTVKGAKIVGHEFSSDLSSAKSVTINLTASQAGPQDVNRGVFVSGSLT